MKMNILLIVAALTGCTMEGSVSAVDKNRTVTCTDTRDGEVFSFSTNKVTNVRGGIGAPSSFDIITTDGKELTLNSTMESFLKCTKSKKGG